MAKQIHFSDWARKQGRTLKRAYAIRPLLPVTIGDDGHYWISANVKWPAPKKSGRPVKLKA